MTSDLGTARSPQGRTNGDDPVAAAEHSADIADMMATRSEAHAGRANDSAGEAEHYANLAQVRSSTADLNADRAGVCADTARLSSDRAVDADHQVRRIVHAAAMLAIGIVLGCLLTILGYVAVVRIVHDTVGITQQPVVYDTRTVQPDSPSDKDAGPGSSDVTAPGRGDPLAPLR